MLPPLGCSPSEQSQANLDEQAIRDAHQALDHAALARDWDAHAAMYTDSAVVLPPGHAPVVGPDAIVTYLSDAPPIVGGEIELLEVEVSGDLAYVRGQYAMTVMLPDGDSATGSGNMLEIWFKGSDGRWRLARDIWNSDRPSP
ncbi:MAG: DUF4440 domain-containing protein [Gemmatimonadales bacterium]